MTVVFEGFECRVSVEQYENGNTRLVLYDIRTGTMVTVATINPSQPGMPHLVAIRNFDDNEGLEEALLKSNVITQYLTDIEAGGKKIPVWTLSPQLVQPLDESVA